jgi:branched-chain amino acid transport system ATP-binding protein
MTAPPHQTTASGLAVENLSAGYDGAGVLEDVTFELPSGRVLAVLGANGAGKSTLAGVLSGLLRPTSGRVVLDGKDVTSWSAHRRARHGVVHVLEGRGVFPHLTVEENLCVAFASAGSRAQVGKAIDQAFVLFPNLAERRRLAAGALSGGERQMLALARAVVLPSRLVVADEVSLGLAPKVVDKVFETLTSLRERGATVVLIEQFVDRALSLADHAVVLRRGSVAWQGPADEAGRAALDQYLGASSVATRESQRRARSARRP